MANQREVKIPIGKRTHDMQTGLDDYTLGRIVKTVNDVYDSLDEADPDRRVIVTCLQLAYNLEKFSRRLESLNKRLDDLKFIQTEKESD